MNVAFQPPTCGAWGFAWRIHVSWGDGTVPEESASLLLKLCSQSKVFESNLPLTGSFPEGNPPSLSWNSPLIDSGAISILIFVNQGPLLRKTGGGVDVCKGGGFMDCVSTSVMHTYSMST